MSKKKKRLFRMISLCLILGMVFTTIAGFIMTVQAEGLTEEPIAKTAVFRLYNPNSGEHFFTVLDEERVNLVKAGWSDEGVAFFTSVTSDIPLYRVYNPNTGDHHYTVNQYEYDMLCQAGWSGEGIAFYTCNEGMDTIAVYRRYNPNATVGTHHYTINVEEAYGLSAMGWSDEGIAFYGYPSEAQDTIFLSEFMYQVNSTAYDKGQNTYCYMDGVVRLQNLSDKIATYVSLEFDFYDVNHQKIGEKTLSAKDLPELQESLRPISASILGKPASIECKIIGVTFETPGLSRLPVKNGQIEMSEITYQANTQTQTITGIDSYHIKNHKDKQTDYYLMLCVVKDKEGHFITDFLINPSDKWLYPNQELNDGKKGIYVDVPIDSQMEWFVYGSYR